MGEIARVAAEKCGIVRERDAGNFQIHRANPDALTTEVQKEFGGISIPGEDEPVGEDFHLPLKFGICGNLTMRIGVPTDFSEPAAYLFLNRDHGDCHVWLLLGEPGAEALAGGRVAFPFREMVCIKNQQALFRKFAALDTRVPAGQRFQSPGRL